MKDKERIKHLESQLKIVRKDKRDLKADNRRFEGKYLLKNRDLVEERKKLEAITKTNNENYSNYCEMIFQRDEEINKVTKLEKIIVNLAASLKDHE